MNKKQQLQKTTPRAEEARPKLQPATGPKLQPATGPKLQPATGPKLQPATGPKLQPAAGPKLQPAAGPKIQPAAGPKIQPAERQKIQPAERPKLQPAAGPKIQPAAGPKIQPAERQKIQPAERPKIQPAAGPKIQTAAGPKIQPATGPKIQTAAGPKIQPAARPKIQPAERPKIQTAAGPKVQPAERPKIQPAERPKIQPAERPKIQTAAGPKIQPAARLKLKHIAANAQNQPTKKTQRLRKSQATEEEFKKPLVVIAIDFGTVHSGFAYSFQGTEHEIQTAQRCYMLEQDRVPTALLLNPDSTFHSFGSDAQKNYYELFEIDKKQFSYVENFKMQIYQKDNITRDMEIPDISGKKVKAILVFSMAIKHLKNLAEKIVFQTKLELKKTFIQWMITIPAISSDSSRQFMREAAMEAGIPDKGIRLVLEPEAAALYSRPRFMQGEVPVGFKYILADLGGGTSDICIHETLSDGKLREIYRATGEITGGSDVDKQFIDFMKELVGNEVWQEFSSNHSSACISLINDFQIKKKTFQQERKTITLRMENALMYVLRETGKTTLQDVIKETGHADKLDFKPMEYRLIIQGEIIEEFFKPSVDEIIYKLRDILEACHETEIKTLLLVGGYSESPYVRERIQAAFSNLRVVLVDDARLAVLKGAVMMGWKPKNIIQRRSRFTYGFSVINQFIEGEHPESLMYREDGEVWCAEIFQKMIEKGQIVKYGQTFIYEGCITAREPEVKHEERYTLLYRSTRENPQYCTEEECTEVGYIVRKPPPEGWPDYWDEETHLIVGETELTVKYFNLTSGQEYEAQMDFL